MEKAPHCSQTVGAAALHAAAGLPVWGKGLGLQAQLHPLVQLPERQWAVSQLLGFQPLAWKTQTEFWVPDIGLARP